jgi:DNA-binding NarL/FixJ family response regulator
MPKRVLNLKRRIGRGWESIVQKKHSPAALAAAFRRQAGFCAELGSPLWAEAMGKVAAELADHTGEDDLSSREIDVLRLIATGNANKEIAFQLSIAEETVKSHVTNILAKLGANDRTHAVTLALKRGIIEL